MEHITFENLGISQEILQALEKKGYGYPTEIQEQAIPPLMEWKDVIAKAPTGTGKTFAFGIPVIEHIDPAQETVQAAILAPTRELAIQIGEELRSLLEFKKGVRVAVLYGGQRLDAQAKQLAKKPQIVVATPGRLMDHYKRKNIRFDSIKTVVLDEADRMLDMGFIRDVRKIIGWLPKKRQTLLFSATMPQEIAELSQTLLREPVRVEVTPQSSTVDAIRQKLYRVEQADKKCLLQEVLQDKSLTSVLVFTNTKHRANRVAELLNSGGIAAMAIHGNKSQSARVLALGSFKAGTIRVLVATDIAARGIDVSGLPCVINYELPNVPETYVHRIGRTGRAGRPGLAISFCNREEEAYLRDIEKLIGKKIPVVRADGPSGREEIEKKVSEPKATPKPTPKPARAKEELSRAPGQKLKLEPLPPLRPLPPEPPKPRRAFRSDPWVPGRVVASADGRRGKRRGRTPET